MTPVSMNPNTHEEGGGLLSDEDVKVLSARYVDDFNYNGTQPATVALKLSMNCDKYENPIDQHYALGRVSDGWVAVNDGKGADNTQGKAPKKSSNFSTLMASLVEAGFPVDKLDSGDASVLDGLQCHVVRKKIARTFRDREDDGKGQECLVVTKINALPGETAAAAPAANDAVVALVTDVLKGNKNELPKAQLLTMAFQAAPAELKGAVTTFVQDEAQLQQHFALADGVVKIK